MRGNGHAACITESSAGEPIVLARWYGAVDESSTAWVEASLSSPSAALHLWKEAVQRQPSVTTHCVMCAVGTCMRKVLGCNNCIRQPVHSHWLQS